MPSVQRRALGEISNRAGNNLMTPSASVKKPGPSTNLRMGSVIPPSFTTAAPLTATKPVASLQVHTYPEPETMGKRDDSDLSDEELSTAEIQASVVGTKTWKRTWWKLLGHESLIS